MFQTGLVTELRVSWCPWSCNFPGGAIVANNSSRVYGIGIALFGIRINKFDLELSGIGIDKMEMRLCLICILFVWNTCMSIIVFCLVDTYIPLVTPYPVHVFISQVSPALVIYYLFHNKSEIHTHTRLQPYHVENTGSHLITKVKQHQALLELGLVTIWEYHAL